MTGPERGRRGHSTEAGALWLLLLFLPGCANDQAANGADDALASVVDTVAGRVVVRNEGTPPSWTLEPILRLGRAAITGEGSVEQFGRLAGVIADEAGRVYVADELVSEIHVFTEEGRHVRTLGGDGGGPGEFGRLLSIGWIGDTLAGLDAGNARLGLLTADGEWLGQRAYMPLAGENIRLYPTGPHDLWMPFLRTGGGESSLVFVRQTASGAADTLPWSRDVYSHRNRVLCRHSGGQGISSYVSELAPVVLQTPAPGVLTARVWTADYEIAFVDSEGDTVRLVRRDLESAPLTEAEWDAERTKFDEFLASFDDEECEPARLPRPTERELIRILFFDDRGRMWVERRAESGLALDVFDPTGRLIGSLESPQRDERVPPYVRSDRLYLAQIDSLGVQYVRVFRVRGP